MIEINHHRYSFPKLLTLGFLAVIAVGTILLLLPFATRPGSQTGVMTALFTSTSATCVTGLTLVDTATHWTPFGQLVIAFLMEIGGLGFMTFAVMTSLLIRRRLKMSTRFLVQESLNLDNVSQIQVVTLIIKLSLLIQLLGTALLYADFGPRYGWGKGLWYSFFHSISAFCNAGLSPFPESMIGQTRWTQMTVAALIVLGGLGVYVIYDLLMVFRRKQYRLRVHSRVVLVTTLILIVAGSGLLWLNGWARGTGLSWYDAIFQSVAARTAGFNSVDIGELPAESLTLIIILMLIGAAPGSTGGGMKVSTVALAVASIVGTFKGTPEVQMFRRTIPISNVLRAYTIMVTFILLTCAGAVFLHMLTPDRFAMMECFFESASAISTTGLSTGATSSLTSFGKIYLACYMFVGRIGPFTIMLFLLSREKKRRLRYPEERIIIG